MEFGEKLQELRKNKGLTQEELAELLYVSRTAVSKWESGRGYPNIDSLKEISKYFSVSIDDLLSGEKLISIAEKENKSNIQNMCDLLSGVVDIFSFILIVLPLYPKTVDGYVYSVNLFAYNEIASIKHIIYWIAFISLIMLGIVKTLLMRLKPDKSYRILTDISIVVNTLIVLLMALTREAYAVIIAFSLLMIKGLLLLKRVRNE